MIEVDRISKTYGKVQALQEISLRFELGQSIAVLGPNASGKTTLIKSILGMVNPQKGRISFGGRDIRESRTYLQKIGYMPQIGRYPDHMRVGQVIDLMQALRSSIDHPKLDHDLLSTFKLSEIFHKSMYTLSGGTRQKLGAALAFLFDPDVLILDEPTASLDPISRECIKEKISDAKAKGKLIIISSHILSELDEVISDVLYLSEGKQLFFLSLPEVHHITQETQLPKAITKMVQYPHLI